MSATSATGSTSGSIDLNLPSDQTGWSSEKTMHEVRDHALAQWNSNEAAFSIAEHVVKAEDIYMITHDGRRLIDFNSQAVCTNLGYSCPEIAEAVYDQLKNAVAFAESRWYVTTVRSKVIEKLRKEMPTMDRFYFSESGATAIEASIRLARAFTGRSVVLSSSRAYHGSSTGAMSLTGGGDDRKFTAVGGFMENVVPFVDHAPYYVKWGKTEEEEIERFLDYLEEMLQIQGPNRVAAILLETSVGTQGAIPSPPAYLLGVQKLCRKFGCLLILDEVMTGFFRTGNYWFGYQRVPGLEPDIVTIAKGLTNAYVPLGGVCVNKKVGDFFCKTAVPIGSTYNAHPAGLAAAWACLQIYDQRQVGKHVAAMEPIMQKLMAELKAAYPDLVQAARSTGLHGCVEIKVPSPADNQDLHNKCVAAGNGVLKKRGLVTFFKYNRHMRAIQIMCNPPLCIKEDQLKTAITDILGEVCVEIKKVLA